MTVSKWDPFTVISISKLLLEMLHDMTYLSVSPTEQIPKIIIRINTLSDYILYPSFRFNQVGLCFFAISLDGQIYITMIQFGRLVE